MQYWPAHRWDELLGHCFMSWVNYPPAQMTAGWGIVKGVLEDYFSHTLAWELFEDPIYLAKRYLYYLLYEWMFDHHDRPVESYTVQRDEYDAYIRWEFIALLLDRTILARSEGSHSLEEAIRWLYGRYAGSGVSVDAQHLEEAIEIATGVEVSDIFQQYVYRAAKLPVYHLIEADREHFQQQASMLEMVHAHNYMHGHIVPWFLNIVLAAALGEHLPHALLGLEYGVDFAEHVLERYDLDSLTEQAVIEALSNLTGVDCSGFFSHWEDTYGVLSLSEVVAWLRVYSELGRDAVHRALFDESGRGPEWGASANGSITWVGALVESRPTQIQVCVTDSRLVETRGGQHAVAFGVEFREPQGWGDAIIGFNARDKDVFSHKYDGEDPTVKYFEIVWLPVTRAGASEWQGQLSIRPYLSISRFTVGTNDDAFGVDALVVSSEEE